MRRTGTFAASLAAGIAAMLYAGASLAQERTLQLGHLANEENSWHKAAVKFGEELEALTDGRITVEVYPNESLGREMDLINGMQLGTADMTITGESLQNWAPMAALLAIPYGYTSLEDMDEVASGEIGEQIEQEIIERAQVRPIAYFARGPRNLTSNRAITSPDELNGMSLRVPNVPLFVDVWDTLGASPTPMAFSEVFTSLQNRTIDGQENPLALIHSANFNEVQSHVNLTEHVRSWIYLAISELTWNDLSEEDQEAVALVRGQRLPERDRDGPRGQVRAQGVDRVPEHGPVDEHERDQPQHVQAEDPGEERQDQPDDRAHQHEEDAVGRTAPEERGEQHGDEDQRRAEVGLDHHQRHGHHDHGDGDPELEDRLGWRPPRADEPGQQDDRGQVRELGGLDQDEAQVEPAPRRLAGAIARADEKRGHQHPDGEDVEGPGRPFEPPELDPPHDEEGEGRADPEPDELALPEDGDGATRRVQHAGRVDHGHAEQ
jgi:TRAP-type transport system periplasmic protein